MKGVVGEEKNGDGCESGKLIVPKRGRGGREH